VAPDLLPGSQTIAGEVLADHVAGIDDAPDRPDLVRGEGFALVRS
jgi:hypothetical protein